MQQKNCMFCAIAHVLFKKPAFSHFKGFIGLNNARKYCFPAQGWQPLPDVFCRLLFKNLFTACKADLRTTKVPLLQ
ncbi:hypothetical protein [Rahnella bonaserana]|uniref:Uncharacterized protein n=1 Tax=Rahnella bonaserana TaxID=2816248 RepID=A0ABS6LNY7_9GAMM|nr:hypothetical protein [Rahnella bonaserana]MBU9853704.1 hypothetical protein [Rahnella bonaserana]MCL9645454.1 hypothetical protein [Rahnella victoriana]WHZ40457.1 hypothetical protein QNM34_21035 [Rahnella bonaserana]